MKTKQLIHNIYRISSEHRIHHGYFGDIYQAVNTATLAPVAVKVQTANASLHYEYKLYRLLTGSPGIPSVYYIGQHEEHAVLVMDFLGPSLHTLFDKCNRIFSIKTVCMIAEQVFLRLETLHVHGFIHGDIRPSKFLIGRHKSDKLIYLIGFSRANRIAKLSAHQCMPNLIVACPVGNIRYASINTHLGRKQSRLDDLESAMYMLIYFTLGSLPWQDIRAETFEQHFFFVGQKKMELPPKQLCANLPFEFQECLEYIHCLCILSLLYLFLFISLLIPGLHSA